uniref:ELM2 domain-containing protein n=1 Tax=Macrostomum lignano TaxID=282301 RepID=A0A1I8F6Q5_9PLAT
VNRRRRHPVGASKLGLSSASSQRAGSTSTAAAVPAAATAGGDGSGGNKIDPRKTVRGFPKVPGIKDFLVIEEPVDVKEQDMISIVMDGDRVIWESPPTSFANPRVVVSRGTSTSTGCTSSHLQVPVRRCGSPARQADWQAATRRTHQHTAGCASCKPGPTRQWPSTPVVGPSLVFQHFVSCTDEHRRWKEGQAAAEQDKLSKGQIFHRHQGAADCGLAGTTPKKCEHNVQKEFNRVADAFTLLGQGAGRFVPKRRFENLCRAMKVDRQDYHEVAALWAASRSATSSRWWSTLQRVHRPALLPAWAGRHRARRHPAVASASACHREPHEARRRRRPPSCELASSAPPSAPRSTYMQRRMDSDFPGHDGAESYLKEQMRFHQEISNKLGSRH